MYKLEADMHVHSIASGHAYSTILEIAKEASKKQLKIIAITDHGPYFPRSSNLWYFNNLDKVPRLIEDVIILKGAEANIIGMDGKLDIPEEYLVKLDFVLAGFHESCVEKGTKSDHTQAYINVMQNPHVDAISHPDNAFFEVDIYQVVAAAKENNKLIELNNYSFWEKAKGSAENAKKFAQLCRDLDVSISCGSNAHFATEVGNFNYIELLIDELGLKENLIINTSKEKVLNYLKLQNKNISDL